MKIKFSRVLGFVLLSVFFSCTDFSMSSPKFEKRNDSSSQTQAVPNGKVVFSGTFLLNESSGATSSALVEALGGEEAVASGDSASSGASSSELNPKS